MYRDSGLSGNSDPPNEYPTHRLRRIRNATRWVLARKWLACISKRQCHLFSTVQYRSETGRGRSSALISAVKSGGPWNRASTHWHRSVLVRSRLALGFHISIRQRPRVLLMTEVDRLPPRFLHQNQRTFGGNILHAGGDVRLRIIGSRWEALRNAT